MGNSKSQEPKDAVDPAEIRLKSVFEVFTGGPAGDVALESRTLSLAEIEKCFQAEGTKYGNLLSESVRPYIPSNELMALNAFLYLGKQILGLTSVTEILEYYWRVFAGGGAELSKDELRMMLTTCYKLSVHSCGFGNQLEEFGKSDEIVDAIMSSVWPEDAFKIDKIKFFAWCHRNASFIYSGTHSWTMGLWSQLDFRSKCSECTSVLAIVDDIKTGSYALSVQYLWLLSTCLPHAFRQSPCVGVIGSPLENTSWNKLSEVLHWTNLYSSYLQGLSMNRFNFHVFCYKEPTIMFLKFEKGHLYCIGIDDEWRDSSQRFGGSSCIVIQLLPQFKIIQTGANMIFFNTQARGLPQGIQFGKDAKSVMLEIDQDMSTVKHYGVPFKLKMIEVWACGSPAARDAQMQQQQWERKEAERQKNRKLKVEDWKENPDRQLLDWGGVKANHAESARE